jgi:hypothetical protein
MIRWIKKLLGKEQTHEEWLAAHPGKGSTSKGAPGIVTPEEEARVRSQMEGELDAQRTKRDEA